MPTFPATSPTSGGGQITLAQIEQATAPRLGPYYRRAQSSITAGTTLSAYFDALKSAQAIGGVEGMFMLRRGEKTDGTIVVVADGDRQRIAGTPDPATGAVPPDRAWGVAPAAGEYVEFHHLDPTLELRVAVQAGLRRCFFEDRASVTLSSAAAERDLTSVVFWVTLPTQIRRIQWTTAGGSPTLLPQEEQWAQPFEQGGHVWLAGWPDQYPNTLLVTALRPHSTWVNGADSATGPTTDTDLLSLGLDYAAAAAHIEAWRLFAAKLTEAAAAGGQASQSTAAAEFTRQATVQRRPRRRGWSLSEPFGGDSLAWNTW